MAPVVESAVSQLHPVRWEADCVLSEIPAAIGVVDLLAVNFTRNALDARRNRKVGPICSPLRIRILDALGTARWSRIETISRRVGSSPAALFKSTLEPLVELELIEFSQGRIRSTGLWSPLANRVTAIELKLDKWRGALRQADNFALSADRAWVVLDRSRANAAHKERSLFRQMGIGLAVADPAGGLDVVSRPRRRPPIRWLKALIAERAWAAAQQAQTDGLDETAPGIEKRRSSSLLEDFRQTITEADRPIETVANRAPALA